MAIVLAGGRSRRMGRDKALLPVNGLPLLQQVCRVASACTQTTYVVTPWPDRYRHLPLGGQFIPEDPDTACGPLAGFALGLQQVTADWVLLLACDLPCLDADSLRQGIAQLDRVGDDRIALLHRSERGWEPLCGFYRTSCLASVQAFLHEGGRSFQMWLAGESPQEWDINKPQLFFNCNTPADWARLRSVPRLKRL
ncbi:molybdenum cofactor guanylyltransferase [Synechococcus sp. PCC 7336]|uniref:molybdenum cofactor guanylyltransferase n=1 Tax=Synechococcus sp. PCC 7336 TaxID=195250 RepID=UPI00034C9A69|nr:molybdenum cofactor guanylyltransferase [Synechococcus sp. PCC 7336]